MPSVHKTLINSLSTLGSSPSLSSKKPRSGGLFSSLFCCLCRDQPEPPPVNNNAPLLVEENGTVSKVCSLPSGLLAFVYVLHSKQWRDQICVSKKKETECQLLFINAVTCDWKIVFPGHLPRPTLSVLSHSEGIPVKFSSYVNVDLI